MHGTQLAQRVEEAIFQFFGQPALPSPVQITSLVHEVADSEKGHLASLSPQIHDDLTGHSRCTIHRFTERLPHRCIARFAKINARRLKTRPISEARLPKKLNICHWKDYGTSAQRFLHPIAILPRLRFDLRRVEC